ncbi:hypothetical protein OUHCRE4_48330 [Enterobacter hormaechei subsp. steigerwaltii]
MPIQSDTPSIMAESQFNSLSTKLDAVNLCMRAIGRSGVDNLTSGDLDAEDADTMIDIVSQRLQYNDGKGWWFNREPRWSFAPDSNGEVVLPNNTLQVLQAYTLNTRKIDITIRAGRLYSTRLHSFDVSPLVGPDGFIWLDLMLMLPFEHMPLNVLQAIAYQAAAEFIVSKDADQTKLQMHMQMAANLHTGMQVEESKQNRLNMLVHNPTQRNFGIMAGGPNNTAGFDHSPYDRYPVRPWRW